MMQLIPDVELLRTSLRAWTGGLVGAGVLAGLLAGVGASPAVAEPVPGCGTERWVSSWLAAPTDSASVVDGSLAPTLAAANQSFRVVLTPHLGSRTVRVHLTNRHRPVPLTFARVTIGKQLTGSAVVGGSLRDVTFGGSSSVTLGPGSDIVSDPVDLDFAAWEPLSLSMFVPGLAALPTEHFNGNATNFYGLPGTGDLTTDVGGAPFSLSTTSVPFASGLDVMAPAGTSTLITLGDSITDGYSASDILGFPNPLSYPQAASAINANARYPDFLQRRIDSDGLPIAVANAGVSGNRVIASGFIPQFSDSMVARLQDDVLDVASVSDVVLLGGTNDLGIPIGASFEQLTAGYTNVIDRLHAEGIAVHLGTIPPASNAIFDGVVTLPYANPVRLRVNEWIRTEADVESVADFDAALRDSANPDVMAPKYAGPDNLHPSAAGYEAMAAAIDLTKLRGSTC